MTLLALAVGIIVFLLLMWAVDLLPGDQTLKQILKVVLIIVLVLWLLNTFGVINGPLTRTIR